MVVIRKVQGMLFGAWWVATEGSVGALNEVGVLKLFQWPSAGSGLMLVTQLGHLDATR